MLTGHTQEGDRIFGGAQHMYFSGSNSCPGGTCVNILLKGVRRHSCQVGLRKPYSGMMSCPRFVEHLEHCRGGHPMGGLATLMNLQRVRRQRISFTVMFLLGQEAEAFTIVFAICSMLC